MAKPITQDEITQLRETCQDIGADLGALGKRLQQDFMSPLDEVAQTMQSVANAQRALAEVAAGLAIRLALREQEADLRTKLTKEG